MFTLTFSTDNAAFDEGDLASEVHRILFKLGNDVRLALEGDTDYAEFPLFDTNGNRVGMAVYDRNA